MASSKSTSHRETGFDKGKTIGRALKEAISLTTSSVKAFCSQKVYDWRLLLTIHITYSHCAEAEDRCRLDEPNDIGKICQRKTIIVCARKDCVCYVSDWCAEAQNIHTLLVFLQPFPISCDQAFGIYGLTNCQRCDCHRAGPS